MLCMHRLKRKQIHTPCTVTLFHVPVFYVLCYNALCMWWKIRSPKCICMLLMCSTHVHGIVSWFFSVFSLMLLLLFDFALFCFVLHLFFSLFHIVIIIPIGLVMGCLFSLSLLNLSLSCSIQHCRSIMFYTWFEISLDSRHIGTFTLYISCNLWRCWLCRRNSFGWCFCYYCLSSFDLYGTGY